MDPRLGGVLLGVAIIAGIVVAWMTSTVILCVVLYIMVKGKNPMVARPSELLCIGYSLLWGVLITFWFALASLILDVFIVQDSSLLMLSPDLRNGLVIDALNFAMEVSIAVYATSLFLRSPRSSIGLAVIHPSVVLMIFVGVTFGFDLYRENVRSLDEISFERILGWYSGAYIQDVITVVWAILQDPASILKIIGAYLQQTFDNADGNMFRLTPIFSFLLAFLMVGRIINTLLGRPRTSRLRLVSDQDFQNSRQFYFGIMKWLLGWSVAILLLPLAYHVQQVSHLEGFAAFFTGLLYWFGWFSVVAVAFLLMLFTLALGYFSSAANENVWKGAIEKGAKVANV